MKDEPDSYSVYAHAWPGLVWWDDFLSAWVDEVCIAAMCAIERGDVSEV